MQKDVTYVPKCNSGLRPNAPPCLCRGQEAGRRSALPPLVQLSALERSSVLLVSVRSLLSLAVTPEAVDSKKERS